MFLRFFSHSCSYDLKRSSRSLSICNMVFFQSKIAKSPHLLEMVTAMMRPIMSIAPLMEVTAVDHVLTLKNALNVNAILEILAVKFLMGWLEMVTAMI